MKSDQSLFIKSKGGELVENCLKASADTILTKIELKHICKEAINVGCLKLARGSLAILLSQIKDNEECEIECEFLSVYHREAQEACEGAIDQLWKKELQSYTPNAYRELIRSLLIHDKSNLAYILVKFKDADDELLRLITDIECGRLQKEDDNIGQNKPDTKITTAPSSTAIELLQQMTLEPLPFPFTGSDISDSSILLKSLTANDLIFFNAHIIPKSLLIPLNAVDKKSGEYNYNHPAMDAPSLLFEKNLPEAGQWIRSIDRGIQAIQENNSSSKLFEDNWKEWPEGIEFPDQIYCRIGLSNSTDILWSDQISVNNNIRIISDYCPAGIIKKMLELTNNVEYLDSSNKDDQMAKMFKFALGTSYLLKFNPSKTIIDISSSNLLYVMLILAFPSPVKFILVDFPVDILKRAVQASCYSTSPLPLPFIFDDNALKEICEKWYELNQLIKQKIPHNRLLIINECFYEQFENSSKKSNTYSRKLNKTLEVVLTEARYLEHKHLTDRWID